MPTYDFFCETCHQRFEKRLSFSGSIDDISCPKGHKHVRRVFSAPTVVFKGKGFYVTDHRPKGNTE